METTQNILDLATSANCDECLSMQCMPSPGHLPMPMHCGHVWGDPGIQKGSPDIPWDRIFESTLFAVSSLLWCSYFDLSGNPLSIPGVAVIAVSESGVGIM